jgi:hypothetical protein
MKKKTMIFLASFALIASISVASFGHETPTPSRTTCAQTDTIKSQTGKRSSTKTAVRDTTKSSTKQKSDVSSDTTSKK